MSLDLAIDTHKKEGFVINKTLLSFYQRIISGFNQGTLTRQQFMKMAAFDKDFDLEGQSSTLSSDETSSFTKDSERKDNIPEEDLECVKILLKNVICSTFDEEISSQENTECDKFEDKQSLDEIISLLKDPQNDNIDTYTGEDTLEGDIEFVKNRPNETVVNVSDQDGDSQNETENNQKEKIPGKLLEYTDILETLGVGNESCTYLTGFLLCWFLLLFIAITVLIALGV